MQMDASIHRDIPLVVLSLAIGFGASLFGLWLVVRVRTRESGFGIVRRLAAAVLLGLGVAGLHYTAMRASSFWPSSTGMAPGARAEDKLARRAARRRRCRDTRRADGRRVDRPAPGRAGERPVARCQSRAQARTVGNAREGACEAIRELAAADYVLLIEPGGDEISAVTASCGIDSDADQAQIAATPQVLETMRTGRYAFLSDLPQPTRAPRACNS